MLYKMLGVITVGIIIVIIFHFLSAEFLVSYFLSVVLMAVQMQMVTEQVNVENRKCDSFEAIISPGCCKGSVEIMYSKVLWKQKCSVVIGTDTSALQVTESLMLFICIYILFQSLLISDSFHLILKQKAHRLFHRVQSYTVKGFILVFFLSRLCGI